MNDPRKKRTNNYPAFYSYTILSDVIQSFISSTNAQLIYFKILKFTTIAPTCFGLTKPSSGSLQFVLH
jgi:hypothetical protein